VKDVEASGVYAVIAPQMGKQVGVWWWFCWSQTQFDVQVKGWGEWRKRSITSGFPIDNNRTLIIQYLLK
jgi:hypothetical protein